MLTLYCLCAAWCTTCEAFRAEFEALRKALPNAALCWIDIEDEADLVDPVDVETFPTLLVMHDGAPVFFGPVRPQSEHVLRVVSGTDAALAGPMPPEVMALCARLNAAQLSDSRRASA